jgi:uncharacterized protein YggE
VANKSSLYLVVAITSLFLSGCWNKNFNEPGRIEVEKQPTEAAYGSSFPKTWAAVQAVMAKFPIIKKDVDKTTGRAYIQTDWVRGKSDTLYHGFDVNRIPYVIRYKMTIYVVGASNGTQVTIKNVEQYLDDVVTAGVDSQGSLQSWIRTESSTLKENALLQQIDKLLRDPKFKPTTLD